MEFIPLLGGPCTEDGCHGRKEMAMRYYTRRCHPLKFDQTDPVSEISTSICDVYWNLNFRSCNVLIIKGAASIGVGRSMTKTGKSLMSLTVDFQIGCDCG
jgi:hypothetical protein